MGKVIDTYCIKGKERYAEYHMEFAWEYINDFPQKEDIKRVMKHIEKTGKYIKPEGMTTYENAKTIVLNKLAVILQKMKQ